MQVERDSRQTYADCLCWHGLCALLVRDANQMQIRLVYLEHP